MEFRIDVTGRRTMFGSSESVHLCFFCLCSKKWRHEYESYDVMVLCLQRWYMVRLWRGTYVLGMCYKTLLVTAWHLVAVVADQQTSDVCSAFCTCPTKSLAVPSSWSRDGNLQQLAQFSMSHCCRWCRQLQRSICHRLFLVGANVMIDFFSIM